MKLLEKGSRTASELQSASAEALFAEQAAHRL